MLQAPKMVVCWLPRIARRVFAASTILLTRPGEEAEEEEEEWAAPMDAVVAGGKLSKI